jgi:hypothetical protein
MCLQLYRNTRQCAIGFYTTFTTQIADHTPCTKILLLLCAKEIVMSLALASEHSWQKRRTSLVPSIQASLKPWYFDFALFVLEHMKNSSFRAMASLFACSYNTRGAPAVVDQHSVISSSPAIQEGPCQVQEAVLALISVSISAQLACLTRAI